VVPPAWAWRNVDLGRIMLVGNLLINNQRANCNPNSPMCRAMATVAMKEAALNVVTKLEILSHSSHKHHFLTETEE